MNVNQIASSAAKDTAGQSTPTSSTGKGLSALSDVNSFLTLLVKQLQNQDPLSPQDGSQFAAQLAQFSSLDQLVGINQRLTQLIDSASAPATSVSGLTTPVTQTTSKA